MFCRYCAVSPRLFLVFSFDWFILIFPSKNGSKIWTVFGGRLVDIVYFRKQNMNFFYQYTIHLNFSISPSKIRYTTGLFSYFFDIFPTKIHYKTGLFTQIFDKNTIIYVGFQCLLCRFTMVFVVEFFIKMGKMHVL